MAKGAKEAPKSLKNIENADIYETGTNLKREKNEGPFETPRKTSESGKGAD